jgi:hypothetical protein
MHLELLARCTVRLGSPEEEKEAGMSTIRRGVVMACCLSVGLGAAAGAGGYALIRNVDVPTGGSATFLPSQWSCNNHGGSVECITGDAYPYVELTSSRSGGVTVKVHTLRDPQGGHLIRSYLKGYPIYTFTAF